MNHLYAITIDDYLEIVELAKLHGKVAGESMEEEFAEIITKKGLKSFGATELTKEEYAKELASHDKNILSFDVDKEGKTTIKNIRKTLDKD